MWSDIRRSADSGRGFSGATTGGNYYCHHGLVADGRRELTTATGEKLDMNSPGQPPFFAGRVQAVGAIADGLPRPS